MRAVLAACSLGAAAIHLAMVPSHASEWLAEGIGFALAGWLQLALAIAFLTRPSRPVLLVAAAANSVFIAAWVWTRAVGAPFGPESGIRHDAGFIDVACVVLEAVIVAISALALSRPQLGERLSRASYAPLSVVPAAIVVLATVAIASPSASGHAHGDAAAGHAHGDEAATGEAHDHASDSDGADVDGHAHTSGGSDASAGPEDDRGLALLSNGEMAHEYGPDQPLDAVTRAALVRQLSLTRLVVDQYPTLGDARAAGSQPAGGFVPGMGLHVSAPRGALAVPPADPSVPVLPGTLSDAEVLAPSQLLYDGTTDDAPISGLMYYSLTQDEPEGFAGPNDHWHTHGSLCVRMDEGVRVLHPDDHTEEGCEGIGGFWVEQTQWMVHVWTVPGYESNRGVFSDINPAIACPDGTYYTVAEEETERFPVNKCRSSPE